MDRLAVKSKNLKSVGYDEESMTLQVEFHRGGIYDYYPITSEGYMNLMNAPSKGQYFESRIKKDQSIKCVKVN